MENTIVLAADLVAPRRTSVEYDAARSNSDASPLHQVRAILRVPDAWIRDHDFDSVELLVSGRISSCIKQYNWTTPLILLKSKRVARDFHAVSHPSNDVRPQQQCITRFNLSQSQLLPPTLSERDVAFQRQDMGGYKYDVSVDVRYDVDVVFYKGKSSVRRARTHLKVPRPRLTYASATESRSVAVKAALPKLLRKTFSAKAADDLQITAFTPASLPIKYHSNGVRTISVPVALTLTDPSKRRLPTNDSQPKANFDIRWDSIRRVKGKHSSSRAKLADEEAEFTTSWRQRGLELSFAPFYGAAAQSASATTAELDVPLPPSLTMPSFARSLLEYRYALKLSVRVHLASDAPMQSATLSVPFHFEACPVAAVDDQPLQSGQGSNDAFPSAQGDAALAPPPYQRALSDEVVAMIS